MSSEELTAFHENKVENFYRTVDILIKGWENCFFYSSNEKDKFSHYLEGLKYLIYDRKISLEVMFEFNIGFGEELYRNEDNMMERVVSIYYPMYAPVEEKSFLAKQSDYKLVKLKARGLLPKDKKHQRIMPRGAEFGVFGLNTLNSKFEEFKSNSLYTI